MAAEQKKGKKIFYFVLDMRVKDIYGHRKIQAGDVYV